VIFDRWGFLFVIIFIIISTIVVFTFVSLRIVPEEPTIFATLISQKDKIRLSINSQTNIKSMSIREANYENFYLIQNTNNFEVKIDNISKDYSIEKKKFRRYEYNDYNIVIKTKNKIEYLDIYLVCDDDLYPLETNYYFNKEETFKYDKINNSDSVYKFIIPRNIDKEFNFNITLLSGFKYKLYICIEYPYIESGLNIISNEGFIYKKTQFFEDMDL